MWVFEFTNICVMNNIFFVFLVFCCVLVSDFLMAVWVFKKVTWSQDPLPVPGGDTPAANWWSNQRWLTLEKKYGHHSQWLSVVLLDVCESQMFKYIFAYRAITIWWW